MHQFFPAPLKSVLIIDDDEIVTTYNKNILKQIKVADKVISFNNPSKALIYLFDCPNEEMPDLILMDLNMPQMNGFEMIEKCRTLKLNLAKTKIFLLSSSRNEDDKIKTEHYREISGFIEKPLNEDKIEMIIENYFESKETRTLVYFNNSVYLIS